jgi:hypothetical protein
MQGGNNWILPKEMNANRFHQDSYWLAICKKQLIPSFGLNGGSVAMDSDFQSMIVSEEPVCIYPFRQIPFFTF